MDFRKLLEPVFDPLLYPKLKFPPAAAAALACRHDCATLIE
jgi:hypothetical protein